MKKRIVLLFFILPSLFFTNLCNAQISNVTTSVTANVSCNGGSNGDALATVSGGTSPYTYFWSNGGTAAISTSNPTGSVLSAGTYTVTVTDNTASSSTASVIITQPTLLSVSVNTTANVSCNGGDNGMASSTVTGGTSPYVYFWNAGAGSASTASGLSAGTYTLSVSDNNGCTSSAIVSITQPNLLSVSASATANISCRGGNNGTGSSTVTGGTSPYTYLWTGGAGSNSTATGLSAGTYTLSVTDNNGCTGSATITISQPGRLRAFTSITNLSCANSNNGSATINVSGGTSPYTYSWSTGGTTNMETGLSAGIYTVVISDSCGTSTTSHPNVRAPRAVAAFGYQLTGITCNGDNNGSAAAIAFGGTTPYTYSWSSGATSTSATGLSAGTYTLMVTDSCGGLATVTVSVTQPSALTVTTHSLSDTTGKVNCSGVASVHVSGGTAPYTYVWSNFQTTSSISSQCSGQYCCAISDANGCLQSACVTINNTTGIENINNSQSVKFYPDPNTGYFTVAGVTPGQVIELYNYIGQKLSSTIADNTTMYFNISTRVNGIYLVRILNKDGSLFTQNKIVKTQ